MRSYLEDDLTNVRLVASDMDFTLLADDKSMPEGMPERILALEEAGMLFAVASGRPLYTLQDLFGASCDHMAFVSDNGGAVTCRGEVVFKDLLDEEVLAELLSFTLERAPEAVPVICGLERAVVPAWGRPHDAALRVYYHEILYVDDIRSARVEANKFTAYFPENNSAAAYGERFAPAFGERLSVTCAGVDWLDIMNRGVDKGVGIARLCDHLGVSVSDVVACGDTDNDVEMLETVGHGYLVANAEERMERFADFRIPSNNERGVAQVIDAILAARRA